MSTANKPEPEAINEGEDDLEQQTQLQAAQLPTWIRSAILLIMILLVGFISAYLFTKEDSEGSDGLNDSNSTQATPADVPRALSASFKTDFANSSVDNWSQIVSGGPGKDGIPAITDPEFEPIAKTSIDDVTRGILVEINGQKKFYPYNILIWHEIVNDSVGGTPIAATFCPLCGSAIVYERDIDGTTYEFGVSGFLRESNMIMYDRTTESLFQQATGEGFAGQFNNLQLKRASFQLLTVFEAKEDHPDAQIMTTNTGFSRDYTADIYNEGYNYDRDNSVFLFQPSIKDDRYELKELFYIVGLNQDQTSVALKVGELANGDKLTFETDGITLTAEKIDSEVFVKDSDGNTLPGYYEMWFSWAVWHQDDGVVWDPSES